MRRFMAAAFTAACLTGLAGPAVGAPADRDDPAQGCEHQSSPKLGDYCTVNP